MNDAPDTVEPATRNPARTSGLHVVLDTNVWLDWLVFGDPSSRLLAELAATGQMTIRSSAHGRGELAEVIARPHFKLSAGQQAECLRRFDTMGTMATEAGAPLTLLCSDPDDQPFLELAVAHRVSHLLSRDRALLKLARRAGRMYELSIMTPEQFGLAVSAPAPAQQTGNHRQPDTDSNPARP